MRIALINEDSQADKNSLILKVLNEVADKYGNVVDNYGMYSEKDKHQINYIQVGILASIILETGMADFVVTGCGTGQGAMISCLNTTRCLFVFTDQCRKCNFYPVCTTIWLGFGSKFENVV